MFSSKRDTDAHFSRKTCVSWHQKGKWSQRWWGGSGINWTICKPFIFCSRQITTPAPHQSIFVGWMPFLPPNQQRQSTESNSGSRTYGNILVSKCGICILLYDESYSSLATVQAQCVLTTQFYLPPTYLSTSGMNQMQNAAILWSVTLLIFLFCSQLIFIICLPDQYLSFTQLFICFWIHFFAFSVGWVTGRAPGGMPWRGYLSGVRCRFAYSPADVTATHCLLLQ